MLILRTLLVGPAHGHQIARHIQRSTDDVLQVEHGSLYAAPARAEGLAVSQMGEPRRHARPQVLPTDGSRQKAAQRGRIKVAATRECDRARKCSSGDLSTPSQSTALLSAFALLALLLASIGLYGVLSYSVTQRTNEIGVPIAMGATSGNLLLSFSRRGLLLTLVGLALGLGLSTAAARLMTALFYGFVPLSSAVALVSLILLMVSALACLVPARRASRIDPIRALQYE